MLNWDCIEWVFLVVFFIFNFIYFYEDYCVLCELGFFWKFIVVSFYNIEVGENCSFLFMEIWFVSYCKIIDNYIVVIF